MSKTPLFEDIVAHLEPWKRDLLPALLGTSQAENARSPAFEDIVAHLEPWKREMLPALLADPPRRMELPLYPRPRVTTLISFTPPRRRR